MRRLDTLLAEGIQSSPGDFPQALLCEVTGIALPLFHGMRQEQQEGIRRCLERVLTEATL